MVWKQNIPNSIWFEFIIQPIMFGNILGTSEYIICHKLPRT